MLKRVMCTIVVICLLVGVMPLSLFTVKAELESVQLLDNVGFSYGSVSDFFGSERAVYKSIYTNEDFITLFKIPYKYKNNNILTSIWPKESLFVCFYDKVTKCIYMVEQSSETLKKESKMFRVPMSRYEQLANGMLSMLSIDAVSFKNFTPNIYGNEGKKIEVLGGIKTIVEDFNKIGDSIPEAFDCVSGLFYNFENAPKENKGSVFINPIAALAVEKDAENKSSRVDYEITNEGVKVTFTILFDAAVYTGETSIVVEKLLTRGADYSDINSTKTRVINALQNIDKVSADENSKKENEKIEEALKEWDTLSYYDKWKTALNSYDLDFARVAFDKEGFKVGPQVTDTTMPTEWSGDKPNVTTEGGEDSLTFQQYMKLKAYTSIIYYSRGYDRNAKEMKKGNLKYPAICLGDWLYSEESMSTFPESIVFNEQGLKPGQAKTDADIIAQEKLPSSIVVDAEAYAFRYKYMVPYITARAYGYTMNDEGGTDAGKIPYNQYLAEMGFALVDHKTTINPTIDMPDIPKLDSIKNDQIGYQYYEALNYLNLIVAEYAESKASGIIWTNPDGTTPEELGAPTNPDLETFLETNKGVEDKSTVDVFQPVAQYIAVYLSIKEGLEYLGIEPWTTKLTYIVSLYDKLLPYKDSKGILDYNPADTDEPMRELFDVKTRRLSDDYLKGVYLSSTYVPMQTNLYDPNSLQCLDELEWVERFHYKYGFYRKALFIDDSASSVVDYYIQSGKIGNQRVATLGDLLNNAGDIALYVDDNFYNVKKLAEIRNMSYSKMANTEEADKDGTGKFFDPLVEMFDMDIENVVKTGPIAKYSDNVQKNVYQYNAKKSLFDILKNTFDASVLQPEDINTYLSYNEYSEMQAFAVVSAIYRHSALYTIVQNESIKPSPVFMASSDLAGVVGVGEKEMNTLINSALLKNLSSKQGIDYKTTLDLTSNIYIDIYGNIITESGLVIVPAAANATLNNPKTYNPLTTAFLSTYGKEYYIEANYSENSTFKTYMSKYFTRNEEENIYQVKGDVTLGETFITVSNLSFQDKNVLKAMMIIYEQETNGMQGFDFNKRLYLITEVLRGAPLENIDKSFEGLIGKRDVDKFGAYIAYKLEGLSEQLLATSNGNSMITLPNPAFMEGVEYIILYGFKILFCVMIIVLMVKLYLDAVRHRFGFKSFLSFISTMVLFAVGVAFVPSFLNMSYYEINKMLLQNETQQIAMLNLEKKADGKEIGVASITAPTTKTQLYMKLDDLDVPWYTVLGKVLTDNSVKTMTEMYEGAMKAHPMAGLPGIESKANGLYMNVDYLFQTSSVDYNITRKTLKHNVHETPYASYVTPYYVILNKLVSNVNNYNSKNNYMAYSTKIQARGSVKTVDLASSYLTSNEFMVNDTDPFGMHNLYKDQTTLASDEIIFSEHELEQMRASLWYSPDLYNEEQITKKLEKIDERGRMFIARNKDFMGKVTDETFLKMMALDLALYHNRVFNITAGKALEIMDLDTRDVMRLSMAPSDVVMKQSSSSFSRFVYDTGGTLGVVLTALLIVVYFISSLVKPLLIFLILGMLIVSVFYKKLVRLSGDRSVEGFIITMGLLCGSNLCYALMLKLSLNLPQFGLTTSVSLMFQIVIQVLYFLIMSLVIKVLLKDWASMGFNVYNKAFGGLKLSIMDGATIATDRIQHSGDAYTAVKENKLRRSINSSRKTKGLTSDGILEEMNERERRIEEGRK